MTFFGLFPKTIYFGGDITKLIVQCQGGVSEARLWRPLPDCEEQGRGVIGGEEFTEEIED